MLIAEGLTPELSRAEGVGLNEWLGATLPSRVLPKEEHERCHDHQEHVYRETDLELPRGNETEVPHASCSELVATPWTRNTRGYGRQIEQATHLAMTKD